MTEERDYESEARQQGWRPKEEFNGPEDKWTDAQTFVEKGEKIAGILKSRVDRLEERLSEAEKANKEFGEYTKTLRERDKEKAQQRIADLEAQLSQAVTDGDGQAYTKLNREINQERESLTQTETKDDNYNALAQQFLTDNPWYNQDPDLQIYADGLAERVANEGYTGKAYFTELTSRVKARFPEKFEKRKSNGVEAGGEIETGSKQAHTYENLPPDAKAACDRFASQGLMSKEDYVKSFEWDE